MRLASLLWKSWRAFVLSNRLPQRRSVHTMPVVMDFRSTATRFVLGVLALTLLTGVARADLVHDWDLNESQWRAGMEVKDLAGGHVGTASVAPMFQDGALLLSEQCHVEASKITDEALPRKELSVEVWVSISEGQKWGSIIGYMQDNGSYERGWSLGYNETAFTFWLSTGGSMVLVTADSPFQVDQWAHVVATYDGEQIQLHVNGKLAGRAAVEGEIAYPEAARYTIGAYRDDNEFYPMRGKMLRAKVYDHALVDGKSGAEQIHLPKPFDFTQRPSVKFFGSDSAEITWATSAGGGEHQVVEFGITEELDAVMASRVGENGTRRVVLTGLDPRTLYLYRIRGGSEKQPMITPVYELNTALNFTAPAVGSAEKISDSTELVADLLKKFGLRKGYAVLPHSFDPELALELARQSDFTVLGFGTDRDSVDQVRRELYASDAYGARISMMPVESLDKLPLTSGMADLVFCESWPAEQSIAEAMRILAPGRGVLCVRDVRAKTLKELEDAGLAITNREGDGWLVARRPALADSGAWTHQYGDTGNTATSGEALGGARATGDMEVQWFGRPGADFGLDRQSRMPAPLAANGRLFHQGMNRLVALNAHNGAVLWGLEIPDLQRLNMPRDASNWCVDDENLFVAVSDQAWMLNVETGQRRAVLRPPEGDEKRDWGYIARSGNLLLGSTTKPGSTYRGFWSGKMWFDGRGGSYGTAQVCSDSLFAYSLNKAPEIAWEYRVGTILNTTIAANDGRVIFVESRNQELKASKTSQIADQKLWSEQFLVALDLETGKKLWERPIDTEDGTVTFYLQVTADAILITASNTQYHLYAFAPGDGEPMWQRSNPWPNDHHSGHIQHPVILDSTVYLQPNGYDLLSGEIVTTKVGSRSGCHTYIGARDALIFRGAGRQVAMWDREKETVTSWPRLRPSCWLSLIPANGMLLIPEGGGGCSCGGWMETSIGFAPVRSIKP
jgi:outer membrane protein assembly factor BamB